MPQTTDADKAYLFEHRLQLLDVNLLLHLRCATKEMACRGGLDRADHLFGAATHPAQLVQVLHQIDVLPEVHPVTKPRKLIEASAVLINLGVRQLEEDFADSRRVFFQLNCSTGNGTSL